MGIVSMVVGTSDRTGKSHSSVCRAGKSSAIWFYLLGSALVFLIGLQLVIYWLLLRVLEELSKREILTRQDMGLSKVGSVLVNGTGEKK
jgi:hypothetical protein